jgi:hypothetical protein
MVAKLQVRSEPFSMHYSGDTVVIELYQDPHLRIPRRGSNVAPGQTTAGVGGVVVVEIVGLFFMVFINCVQVIPYDWHNWDTTSGGIPGIIGFPSDPI